MPISDLPKCASCGSEILLLPGAKGDNFINVGGVISEIDIGQLYKGQICESCRRIICSSCWVKEWTTPESFEVCSKCGGHLIPLTSKNIP